MEKNKNKITTVHATLKNLPITPRKVMLVTRAINHKPLAEALIYLSHTPKRAGKSVLKLVNSAIANAVNNHELNYNDLNIKTIFVTEGRKLKRFRPRAKGVTYPIWKRYSHIKVFLTSEQTARIAKQIKASKEKKTSRRTKSTKEQSK